MDPPPPPQGAQPLPCWRDKSFVDPTPDELRTELARRDEKLDPTPDASNPDGDRALAMTLVLGLLAIGIGVGVGVGYAEMDAGIGILSGLGAVVASALVMWLLFVPLRGITMRLIRPLVDSVRFVAGLVMRR
jgi:hypothetical protein